jgi:putative endonuclease
MGLPHPKGKRGEELAARYLLAQGYQIRARNVHYRGGEIDIVASDPVHEELVFVEVKSRTHRIFGWPEEGVGWRKRKRLRLAASLYLAGNRFQSSSYRFDIIALEMQAREQKAKVVHYKNVEMG